MCRNHFDASFNFSLSYLTSSRNACTCSLTSAASLTACLPVLSISSVCAFCS